jgi:hypothetical protein
VTYDDDDDDDCHRAVVWFTLFEPQCGVGNKFYCFVSVYVMLHLNIYFFFKQIIVIVILCLLVWACVTYNCQEFLSFFDFEPWNYKA